MATTEAKVRETDAKTLAVKPTGLDDAREYEWDIVEGQLKQLGDILSQAHDENALGEGTKNLLAEWLGEIEATEKDVRQARLKEWSASLPPVHDGLQDPFVALLRARAQLGTLVPRLEAFLVAARDAGKPVAQDPVSYIVAARQAMERLIGGEVPASCPNCGSA